ncbi:DUF4907 domain-containing protein [Winogradskyella vidalii]|uniref:DUF4907 domain-containing protein n=1 Tax=Winogradskyella vidalii TaxID=2615024 RepID=UPI0015C86EFD|nr:DUF4907 domain-containing protein [Winogradskyella vidalii]
MKRPYNYIMVFLTITIVILLFFYLKLPHEKSTANPSESPYALQVIEQDSLWIYEIYEEGNLFIRQEFIPAVKGKQVFKSKKDAEAIGKLMVSKLANNEFPAISIADLNQNNIRYNNI